jgi:hypothetical protein
MQLEILALRHQLALYQRCTKKRPPVEPWDRLFWSWLSRLWSGWKSVLHFVQPRTVTTWQKRRFRDHWKRRSQSSQPGRPSISKKVRQLIQDMWQSNPTWGSPRIVGELHKIGIDVAKSTVEAYRPRDHKPSSPTWRAFLNNHVKDIVACDFFTAPTVNFRVLFVFLVLAHDRRCMMHFNITEHPTAQWTAQQIVEAFPWDTVPRYLLRGRDAIYGAEFQNRVGNLGIDEVKIAPRSPWQNPYCERVIGSIRREVLDDVIVLNERHLSRVLQSYINSYHDWRPHRPLEMDAPMPRPVEPPGVGAVRKCPEVGGLHHHYDRQAA